jgi:electron transfer flavoprotein beta subunit
MMNPADRHAIEAALALADAKGGEVTAMTMGQESSESILRDAASLGVKAAYRLTDRLFSGADTLTTATVLKAAIDATGPYDAVFCGASTIDGVTGQIPGKLGTMLGCGILTNACKIEIGDTGLTIDRKAGTGYEKLSAALVLEIVVYTSLKTQFMHKILFVGNPLIEFSRMFLFKATVGE